MARDLSRFPTTAHIARAGCTSAGCDGGAAVPHRPGTPDAAPGRYDKSAVDRQHPRRQRGA
jgi:hypothetical protein